MGAGAGLAAVGMGAGAGLAAVGMGAAAGFAATVGGGVEGFEAAGAVETGIDFAPPGTPALPLPAEVASPCLPVAGAYQSFTPLCPLHAPLLLGAML